MQIPPGAYNSGMGMSTLPGSLGASAATPVTTTSSMNREWDAQSMHSDSVASSALNGSPAIGQGTSIETLRDVVMKRMITLTYMRNVHEGYGNYLSFQRINWYVLISAFLFQEESLVSYDYDDKGGSGEGIQ